MPAKLVTVSTVICECGWVMELAGEGSPNWTCKNPSCKDALTEYEMNVHMKKVDLKPLLIRAQKAAKYK